MAMPSPSDRDSFASRIPATCPPETKAILSAAWTHDLQSLKPLLDKPGKASVQEPTTRETPLHAAIRSCGPSPSIASATNEEELAKAKAVVAALFQWGGIWNDVDDRNETPGCVALRLIRRDLYDMCVAAGTRAEMLFALLDGYEELGSDEEVEEGEQEQEEENREQEDEREEQEDTKKVTTEDEEAVEKMDVGDFEKALAAVAANASAPGDEHVVTSGAYLASELTYDPKKLVDNAGNGVMMAWETDIMRRSVISLLSDEAPLLVGVSGATTTSDNPAIPSMLEVEVGKTSLPTGRRVLNIGFGMGIIDDLFASTKPSKHHIIEAHPAVLSYINTSDSKFGPAWVDAAESPGANKVWAGRWQDVCPKLLEDGEVYDAIYFDTFGEDYSQLKLFFTEYVPGLLDQDGKFSFFNGLGADRKICYDVYQRVVEMHLSDAGMDVEWQEIDVDMKDMGEEGKGEWEGVVRRYWTLDKYQLPICSFLG